MCFTSRKPVILGLPDSFSSFTLFRPTNLKLLSGFLMLSHHKAYDCSGHTLDSCDAEVRLPA